MFSIIVLGYVYMLFFYKNLQKFSYSTLSVPVFLLLGGCFNSQSSRLDQTLKASPSPLSSSQTQSNTSEGSTSGSSTSSSGSQAVRVYFRTLDKELGSFPLPSSSGTENLPMKGLFATKLYKPDQSILVSGNPQSPDWPAWIEGIEVTLSGQSNLALPNAQCAQFLRNEVNLSDEQKDYRGDMGSLQVSEADCGPPTSDSSLTKNGTIIGNGGPNDGFSIRVYFNRDVNMGPTENILLTLQYQASGSIGIAPDKTSALNCNSATGIKDCPEMLYQVYLKNSPTDVLQPFVMLIPPIHSPLNELGYTNRDYTQKQIFIPLAAYPSVKVIQISRIFGLGEWAREKCGGTLSPRCLGVIFHSLTLHRI